MTSTRTPTRVHSAGVTVTVGGSGGRRRGATISTPGSAAKAAAAPTTAAAAATTTPARRTSPRAKLNLNFSAVKSGGSATKAAVVVSPAAGTTTPSRSASKRRASIASEGGGSATRKPLRVVTNTPPHGKAATAAAPAVDASKILRGVFAMVDVRMGPDASIDCSDAVAKKLAAMGATILKKRGGRLTHVVLSHFTPQWKEKVGKWHSLSTPIEVVSQLWVNACLNHKQRVKESAFFPVNTGFEIAAPTATPSKVAASNSRKRATLAAPARPSSAMGLFASTGTLSLTTTPRGSKDALKPSTPIQSSRAANGNARKRRALSMEPMPSDAILRDLALDTKKLLKQSSDADVYTAFPMASQESISLTPVKAAPRDVKAGTPPLTVRLRAMLLERRKSFTSVSSVSADTQRTLDTEMAETVTGNDCVSESCSEGEEDREAPKSSAGDLLSAQTTVASSGTIASPSSSTANEASQVSVALNVASPAANAKGEWACSICNCMNTKTRRICKGCKASRIAAKTSAAEKTPVKRPAIRTALSTPRPRRRTVTANASALASVVAPPSSQSSTASSGRKASVSLKRPAAPLKRPRLSDETETGSVRSSNDLFSDERLVPSTPVKKKQKTSAAQPPTAAKKAAGPPRAVISITGVDSEARNIIECAVHGIDANMASEPGHRKARVVKSVDYAAGVTHLIIGGEVKRTIKVLFAIARGAWIVSEAWAFTSLEQEKWLNEEDFEVDAFPKRHLRTEPEQRQVFRTLKFFVGSKIDPSREVLISLIQCAGGEIVNQISVANYCICGDDTLFRRAARTKIHGVTPKWIFDSIANLKLEDPSAYGPVVGDKNGDADTKQKK